MRTNSHWFDNEGSYIPLDDREETDTVGKTLQNHNKIEEYTQIGGYIHVFTDYSVTDKELRSYLERHIDCDFRIVEDYTHTYSWITGVRVIKFKMV